MGRVDTHLLGYYFDLDKAMASVVARSNARYVSACELLCPDNKCAALIAGEPLFYDTGHFTRAGSILFVQRMGGAFKWAALQ